MAVITDYATLVSALQEVMEDDGAEFAAYIPTAIDLAEERLFRELDLYDLEQTATGNLTPDSNTLSKPSGYRVGHNFVITVSGNKRTLKKRKKDYLEDYWPDSADTDVPKYYADNTQTQFILAPTPDQDYVYSIRYTSQPTKLSVSATTNYFTTHCKDLLYHAAAIEMLKFMKAGSQIPVVEEIYTKARDSWNIQAMRQRRDGSENPMNPDNAVNSIKHTTQTSS